MVDKGASKLHIGWWEGRMPALMSGCMTLRYLGVSIMHHHSPCPTTSGAHPVSPFQNCSHMPPPYKTTSWWSQWEHAMDIYIPTFGQTMPPEMKKFCKLFRCSLMKKILCQKDHRIVYCWFKDIHILWVDSTPLKGAWSQETKMQSMSISIEPVGSYFQMTTFTLSTSNYSNQLQYWWIGNKIIGSNFYE